MLAELILQVVAWTSLTASAQPVAEKPPVVAGRTPSVSGESYNLLQSGMTHDEVAAILGSPGEEMSSTQLGAMTITTYQWWQRRPHGLLIVSFNNGRLMQKTQIGLR